MTALITHNHSSISAVLKTKKNMPSDHNR